MNHPPLNQEMNSPSHQYLLVTQISLLVNLSRQSREIYLCVYSLLPKKIGSLGLTMMNLPMTKINCLFDKTSHYQTYLPPHKRVYLGLDKSCPGDQNIKQIPLNQEGISRWVFLVGQKKSLGKNENLLEWTYSSHHYKSLGEQETILDTPSPKKRRTLGPL